MKRKCSSEANEPNEPKSITIRYNKKRMELYGKKISEYNELIRSSTRQMADVLKKYRMNRNSELELKDIFEEFKDEEQKIKNPLNVLIIRNFTTVRSNGTDQFLPLAEFSKFSVEDRIAWGLKVKEEVKDKKPEVFTFTVSKRITFFGNRGVVCLLKAKSAEDAMEKLLGFAKTEEEFEKFYDEAFPSDVCASPYRAAVEDHVFLSYDDGFEEEQCYNSRVEFIEKLVVDDRRLPIF